VRQALAAGGLTVSQAPGDGGFQVASSAERAALLAAAAALRARGLGQRGAGILTPPITPGPVPFKAHLELFI